MKYLLCAILFTVGCGSSTNNNDGKFYTVRWEPGGRQIIVYGKPNIAGDVMTCTDYRTGENFTVKSATIEIVENPNTKAFFDEEKKSWPGQKKE